MNKSSWYSIYEKSIECPEEIIEILMDSQQVLLTNFLKLINKAIIVQ